MFSIPSTSAVEKAPLERFFSELRKLSDHLEVVWLNGNHDGPAEIIALLGVRCADETIVESGGRKILFYGRKSGQFIALIRLSPGSRIAFTTYFSESTNHTTSRSWRSGKAKLFSAVPRRLKPTRQSTRRLNLRRGLLWPHAFRFPTPPAASETLQQ